MIPQPDADLRTLNTLQLPASARALARVGDRESLEAALAWARAEGLRVLPLGQGSNVVFAGDVEAMVLQQAGGSYRIAEGQGDTALLQVDAGMDWHQLVQASLAEGLQGLENLALIPGCVGAAPVQNIGAYGVELAPFVEAVRITLLDSGEHRVLDRDACQFGYRDSIFKSELRDRCVITRVDLRLPRSGSVEIGYPALAEHLERAGCARPQPRDVFDAVVAVRSSKLPDPAKMPNAGSFFKNPELPHAQAAYTLRLFSHMPTYTQANGRVKVPAAWLIEQCGWKGVARGGVGVHAGHALVLVHDGSSDGAHLLELAAEIRHSVEQKFHIRLEMEPRVYGA